MTQDEALLVCAELNATPSCTKATYSVDKSSATGAWRIVEFRDGYFPSAVPIARTLAVLNALIGERE